MVGLKDKMILDRLLAEKVKSGLNDGEFAAKIGVSKQQFSDIKKGKRPIGTRIFERIKSRLGLTEDDFFQVRPPPNQQKIQQAGDGVYAVEKLMKIIEQQERMIARLERRIVELEGFPADTVNPINGNGKGVI